MLTFWPVVQDDTKVVAVATVTTIVVLHTLLAIGCKVGEGAPRGGLVAVVHQLKSKLSSFLLLSCTSSRQQTLHWDPFPQPPQFTHRRPPYTNDHRNGVDLGSASESYIQSGCVRMWGIHTNSLLVNSWDGTLLSTAGFTVTGASSGLQRSFKYTCCGISGLVL